LYLFYKVGVEVGVMKKTGLIAASWTGTVIMILATVLSPFIILAVFFGETLLEYLPFIAALLTAVMAAVCGIKGRTSKIWGLMLALGILWLVPLTFGAWIGIDCYRNAPLIVLYWLLLALPGFTLIYGGLVTRRLRRKQEAPSNS